MRRGDRVSVALARQARRASAALGGVTEAAAWPTHHGPAFADSIGALTGHPDTLSAGERSMSERMPQGGLPLVLLGGDGQEATRWLKSLLEGGGYAVLQERLAQHVLERARSPEPDLIIAEAEPRARPAAARCRPRRSAPRVWSSTPILLAVREPASRAQ